MQTKTLLYSLFISLFLLFMNQSGQAQILRLSENYTFKDSKGDTLNLAMTGGLNIPRFSMADINNDGFSDLFVFDRIGNKPIVLIYTVGGGFVHKPEYESVFPALQDWAMFVDYNNDGKADLWGRNEYFNSVSLFRNITKPGDKYIQFQTVSDALMAYNFLQPPLDSNQIFCEKSNVPAIVDIDNDGDMDFLTKQSFGFGVSLFLNNTKESKKPLDPPSFEIVDDCWGNFSESSSSNEIFLKRYQFCRNPYYRYKKHSGGSTILLFDADGDLDKDMLMGNVSYNDMIFLENGKSDAALKYDSIISYVYKYPISDPIEVPIFPAAYLVDLNHDNNPILLAAPSEMDERNYAVNQKNAVQMYKNISSNKIVDFKKVDQHFLNTEILDHGAYSSPAVADINGDGWPDILVMSNGNQRETDNLSDRVYYYRNLGNSDSGQSFQLVTEDFAGISRDSLKECSIVVADIDNDAKPDLIVGKSDGTLSLYKNTTTDSIPSFQWITHNWQNIEGGNTVAPCIVDVNKDGLLDLLLGSFAGTFKYFRNTGTKSSAILTHITDSFGGILMNELRLTTIFDAKKNEWIDTLLPTSIGFSAVSSFISIAGKLTLVCGGEEGVLRFFQPLAGNEGIYKETKEFFYNSLTPEKDADMGSRLRPAAADLDKDGFVDLVCGNSRGGISILEGDETSGIQNKDLAEVVALNVYPNPSSDKIHIDFKGAILNSSIYDLAGHLILTSQNENIVDVSGLKSGYYFITINTAFGLHFNKKLMIIK